MVPPLFLNGNRHGAAYTAVVLSRAEQRNLSEGRTVSWRPRLQAHGNATESATIAEDQAVGGARDWNGARRGATKSALLMAKRSADRDEKVNGRTVGASGVKEILRK